MRQSLHSDLHQQTLTFVLAQIEPRIRRAWRFMPLFYFHIHDGRDQLDTDGTDLPDETTAQVEAIRLAGAVLRDEARRVVATACWNMEVTDATGRPVYRVDVSLSSS